MHSHVILPLYTCLISQMPSHPVTLSFAGYLLPALQRSLSLPTFDHVVLERNMQDLHGSSRKDLPKFSKCRAHLRLRVLMLSSIRSNPLDQRLALQPSFMDSPIAISIHSRSPFLTPISTIPIPRTTIVQLCQPVIL